ncbi:hypothetical protein ACIQGZ_17530 [Streptomyces sp. NPDC092296]|uniref:hypothetical protein n=1 Tax=Streptomyces sp. NPDC092296 TaxID=3366012 RepID=UPI00381D2312
MTAEQRSAERFARETADHEMTVLHDDGLYRHLVFADPDGGFFRFDLITWPHNLFIRGDGFSFGFSVYPTDDMFGLFRGSSHGGINPGYWQEKVTAGKVWDWSEEKFRTWLVVEVASAESRHPGLVEAVGEQILHSDEHSTEYAETARHAVASFSHRDYRLRLPDEWELSFDDYSWEFLFACHAIVWGIARYDAQCTAGAVEVVECRPEGSFFEPDMAEDGPDGDAIVACTADDGRPVAVRLNPADRARLGSQCAPNGLLAAALIDASRPSGECGHRNAEWSCVLSPGHGGGRHSDIHGNWWTGGAA